MNTQDFISATVVTLLLFAATWATIWLAYKIVWLKVLSRFIKHEEDEIKVYKEIYGNADILFENANEHAKRLNNIADIIQKLIRVDDITDKQIRYSAEISAVHARRIGRLELKTGIVKPKGNRIPRKKNRRKPYWLWNKRVMQAQSRK